MNSTTSMNANPTTKTSSNNAQLGWKTTDAHMAVALRESTIYNLTQQIIACTPFNSVIIHVQACKKDKTSLGDTLTAIEPELALIATNASRQWVTASTNPVDEVRHAR
jgi:hypothetical protein